MGRRKSRAAQILDAFKPEPKGLAEGIDHGAEPVKVIGTEWWTKMTLRKFKDTIAPLTYEQCVMLLEIIRQAVRETTLRPHVEDLTLEQQKVAGRLSNIHNGAREALLTKIHMFHRPNASLTD